MMNVLVSAPSMYKGLPFLPYIYGLLRQECDRNQILKNELLWLFPIYLSQNSVNDALSIYDNQDIDVLALSCYEWNWDFQIDLALAVKKKNPKCIIVLGGPQPDWKNENFFAIPRQ